MDIRIELYNTEFAPEKINDGLYIIFTNQYICLDPSQKRVIDLGVRFVFEKSYIFNLYAPLDLFQKGLLIMPTLKFKTFDCQISAANINPDFNRENPMDVLFRSKNQIRVEPGREILRAEGKEI